MRGVRIQVAQRAGLIKKDFAFLWRKNKERGNLYGIF